MHARLCLFVEANGMRTCGIQRAKECVPISMWLWSWFDMVGMERVLTSSEWNGLCFRCVDGSWCYLATMVLPSCSFVWPRSFLVHLMRLYSFTHLWLLQTFPIAAQLRLLCLALTGTSILSPQLLHLTFFVSLLGLSACGGADRFCGLFTGVAFGVWFGVGSFDFDPL